MTELSFLARLVLTLLVSALSLFLYKQMHSSSPSSSASPPPPTSLSSSVKRSKKRSKKPKKGAAKATAVDDSSKSATCAAEIDAPVTVTSRAAEDDDEASESDSDEGLSAAQVLATRRFQPKRLGGTIEAALKLAEDAPRFTAGQNVLARFRGEARWFPARVLERRKGNEYHLKYDDGEVEYRVPADFIKLQVATTIEKEGTSEEGATAQTVVKEAVANEVVVLQPKEETGSDSSSGTSEDDGWQVVATSKAVKKRPVQRVQVEAQAEPLIDGLTKRQRENRRKKERQREKKELLRQHAQKDDLDARARWRYVPS